MLFLPALLFGLLIGSLIGAVILRAACSLFNLFAGKGNQPPTQESIPVAQMADYDRSAPAADFNRPFSSPTTPLGAAYLDREPLSSAVPVPSFGAAIAICFFASVANNAVGFIVGLTVASLAPGNSSISGTLVAILLTVVNFGIFATLIKAMLPTNYPKAAGVAALCIAIGIGVVLAILAVVAMVSLAFGGLS